MALDDEEIDATLILAAEEFPAEDFQRFHRFSAFDEVTIKKLMAHGPVLVRGGRGSGKSALLIEAQRRIRSLEGVFGVYVSLRYLPLLQSDGEEYIEHFCTVLSRAVQAEIARAGLTYSFQTANTQTGLVTEIARFSQALGKRLVLLFDDAAHIGREAPLTVFFDLFRTLSTSAVSCKASIYPGVTRFGVRFDVYNDSTVADISRVQGGSDAEKFFFEVLQARYPRLSASETFSERISPREFSSFVGRAVVGNMRAFVFACTRFNERARIGLPDIVECLLDMSSNYYWPLMEEVAPKLGIYEPMIGPAQAIAEALIDNAIRPVRVGLRSTAQDRVLVHRQYVQGLSKPFEILEYLGFVAKREASRALKSGGRGSVYALNLCNLMEKIPGRITLENVAEWISGSLDPAEIHSAASSLSDIELPSIAEGHDLSILDKDVSVLRQSSVYPYGLTANKLSRLSGAGLLTVGQLAGASDEALMSIETIGPVALRRIRNVVSQAIWM